MPSRNEILGAYLGQIGQGVAQYSAAAAQARAQAAEQKRKQQLLDIQQRQLKLQEEDAKREAEEAERKLKAQEAYAKEFEGQHGADARQGTMQMAQTQARNMVGPTREAAALIEKGMAPYRAMGGGMPAPQVQAPATNTALQAGQGGINRELLRLSAAAAAAGYSGVSSTLASEAITTPEEQARTEKTREETRQSRTAFEQKQKQLDFLQRHFRTAVTEPGHTKFEQQRNEAAYVAAMSGKVDEALTFGFPKAPADLKEMIMRRHPNDPLGAYREMVKFDENPTEAAITFHANNPLLSKKEQERYKKADEVNFKRKLDMKDIEYQEIVSPDGTTIRIGKNEKEQDRIDREKRTFYKKQMEPIAERMSANRRMTMIIDNIITSIDKNPEAYTVFGQVQATMAGLADQLQSYAGKSPELQKALNVIKTGQRINEKGVLEAVSEKDYYITTLGAIEAVRQNEGARPSDFDFKSALNKMGAKFRLTGPSGPTALLSVMNAMRNDIAQTYVGDRETLKALDKSSNMGIWTEDMLDSPNFSIPPHPLGAKEATIPEFSQIQPQQERPKSWIETLTSPFQGKETKPEARPGEKSNQELVDEILRSRGQR